MWYKQQHLNTQRMESAPNVTGSNYMLPDPTANIIYSIIVEVRQSSVQNKHQTCLQVVLKKKNSLFIWNANSTFQTTKHISLFIAFRNLNGFGVRLCGTKYWQSYIWSTNSRLKLKHYVLIFNMFRNPQQATDNLWDNMYILRAFV